MFERPVQRLIDELSRLPGVGRKSAQRLAFHLLNVEEADARRLAGAIIDLREQTSFCSRCYNVTAGEECSICRDPRREPGYICVVERAQDIAVIERTREFAGQYHVLGGALSPIDGIGPSQLRIEELELRIEELRNRRPDNGAGRTAEQRIEIIIATNPTIEGDTTAMYLARRFKPFGDNRYPPRQRPAGRGRHGLRRRDHPRQGPGGPAGAVDDPSLAGLQPVDRDEQHSRELHLCRSLATGHWPPSSG